MAYPGSVTTFTTKNTGDTIQASHVNDLQTEVNAIEAGLINGTAHLQSSNSTVANLSVSGGSTFAGAVTGNDTVTVKELFTTKSPPTVRVYSSANVAVANNAVTLLTFDAQRVISTSAMHSTATNPGRLIPPSSGTYLIGAHVRWSTVATPASTAFWLVRIRVDGSTVIAEQRSAVINGGPGGGNVQSVTTIWSLSTAQYVDCAVYQNTGSTQSVIIDSGSELESPSFWMTKIR